MILALTIAALIAQLAVWIALGVGYQRVRNSPANSEVVASGDLPVTVVVAARNEEGNLPALLDALENQTHTAFDVVVADDGSTDRTAELLEERSARWDEEGRSLTVVRIEDGDAEMAGLPRKKYALTEAIEVAQNNRLVFTDADCLPPPGWLEAITSAVTRIDDPDVVITAYGPYNKNRGLLNAFVRYETLLTAFLTAAAVGWKRPFMAVGRNFSYTKSLFEKLGGFEHSAASLSGDDDLLVQEVVRTKAASVAYLLLPESFVYSDAPSTMRSWLKQKLRHTSAGRYYSKGSQFALLVFHFSNLLLWLGFPALFLTSGLWWGAGFLAIRFLVQRAVLRPVMKQFEVADLYLPQPLLDILYLFYNTVVAPVGPLLKPKRW